MNPPERAWTNNFVRMMHHYGTRSRGELLPYQNNCLQKGSPTAWMLLSHAFCCKIQLDCTFTRASAVMEIHSRDRSCYQPYYEKRALVGRPATSSVKRTLAYHMYTLWLFTFSDLQTIVIPKSAFGIFTILSGKNLTSSVQPPIGTILWSVPFIIAWIWLNLLPLDMNNQHDMDSVLEDKVNKSWRPIPSGRLTVEEARWSTVCAYMVALLASSFVGGLTECFLLMLEGWLYNRLGGANKSWVARNLLNAAGYMTFACGAARVACISSGILLSGKASIWFVLLGLVVSTTIHFQDLYDQEGDAKRHRRTIPLLFGDGLARLSIAIPTAVWSCLCPAFWGLQSRGFILPIVLGIAIILRIYKYRSMSEDKRSFLIWNVWIMSLYLLPLNKTFM